MRAAGLVALASAAVLSLSHGPNHSAAAQSVEEFYKSTRLTMGIGSGTGGSHDLNARIIARHIGRYLPGHPTVVPQNIPGAGSLALANNLYEVAPRNGSMIGALNRAGVFEELYSGKGKARFDPLKLNWLGSPDVITGVAIAWHTSPVKTYKDLWERELIVGASGATTVTVPLILQELVGFKFRIVDGYKSGGDVDLAIERGEVEGRGATAWGGLKSRNADWLRDKKISLLFQTGLSKHPELPDVPLALDFAKNADDRTVLELFFAAEEIGYPYAAPPDVPADRLAALRTAFADVLKDPKLIEEANKQGLDISPVTWERMTEIIHKSYGAPEPLKVRLRQAISVETAQSR